MNISTSVRLYYDNEKILYIIKDVLGASSVENAVTMEEVIAKGIEMGLTSDHQIQNWEGYKQGDHPWWPVVAPMMGIGSAEAVSQNEEPYLHRQKVQRILESGRKSNVMVYWYDRSHKHEVVRKSNKSAGRKKSAAIQTPVVMETRVAFTPEQMEAKVAQNPGKYMIIDGKLYNKEFVRNHPEKFNEMSVAIANT